MNEKFKTIVMIDNEERVPQRYKARLEKEGYEVYLLPSVQALLRWLSTSLIVPQLALVNDISEPSSNDEPQGEFITKLLKTNFPSIVVFALASESKSWSDNRYTSKEAGIEVMLHHIRMAESKVK